MENFNIKQLERDGKFFKQSYNKNITTDLKKTDINVLLNKIKIDKIKEKKKNITFTTSIFFGLILTAFIIFN